jgi:hypothetical protein
MGLAPPYFNGLEDYKNYWISLTDSCNGNSYNIKDFQVEEVREDKREPYSISFVLDHSGSMGDTRIQNLRESVKRILGLIKKGDYISVNQFSGETYTEVSLTDDSSKYKNEFEIAIIPYTYSNTIFKHMKEGDYANIEFDLLGKYIFSYLKNNVLK